MPHRIHRKDANHEELATAIRGRGWKFRSLSSNQGDGIPDGIAYGGGDVYLVEFKVGKQGFTEAQLRFIEEGWPVRVCRTLEDVGRLFPQIG